jgi:hypothetical protein
MKINLSNTAEINTALKTINGGSIAHCFTNASELINIANSADKKLIQLLDSKLESIGAIINATSGDSVSASYKYNRTATNIKLLKGKTAWFLINVNNFILYKSGGKTILTLTAKQDIRAIAVLRNNYRVAT